MKKLSNLFLVMALCFIGFGGFLYQYDLQNYSDQLSKLLSGFASKKSYNQTDISGYELVHDKVYRDNFVERRTRDQIMIGVGIAAAAAGVRLRKKNTH